MGVIAIEGREFADRGVAKEQLIGQVFPVQQIHRSMRGEGNAFLPLPVKTEGLGPGGEAIDASDEDLVAGDGELPDAPVGFGDDDVPVPWIRIANIDPDDTEIWGGEVRKTEQVTAHKERHKTTFDVVKQESRRGPGLHEVQIN